MEPSEIIQIIENEINGNWAISNAHYVNLKRSLVTPVKDIYYEGVEDVRPVELWLVLDEHPETHSGYMIVFDEHNKQFGLAMIDASTNEKIFLGIYGSFLETLEAM